MAQVWKIRLPDGRVYTPGDWTTAEPLYSTVEITTGAFGITSAFSYGIGADVPGSVGPRESTLVDTNLEGEGARLPENEELIIYDIAIEFFKVGAGAANDVIPQTDPPDVALLDVLRVQRDLNIELRIADVKNYTKFPVSYFPASTGVNQVNSGARAVANVNRGWFVGNNGSTDVQDVRVLASPLYVAGGESLRVDFDPGPGSIVNINLRAADRIRIRTYLDGYRRRPVA